MLTVRERGFTGRMTEELGVTAFRAFWNYLGDKRWATDNVAMRLRKPGRVDSSRRGWRPEEAALARHLARGLKPADPLLSEVTLCFSERMALRRAESGGLRMCEVNWDRAEVKVHGKGGKPRTMPIPPVFFAVLVVYVEQRRPGAITPEAWLRSDEYLLRQKPTRAYPMGQRSGFHRVDRLMRSLPVPGELVVLMGWGRRR